QDYPMLVQSEVLSEDQKSPAPFVVTPPLFRLDGQQSSRLRIVRTGGEFPSDRESLQWICVKGIPPKEDD
ncbi:Dr fimbrial biogenesis chaperone DraB, partial [Escherichia coli]|nr:Dr fimbrial biogenesis chaperone DraB [Escherichia coli]